MKKIKESLLFIVLLFMPILVFIVLGFSAEMISDKPRFIGFVNYIRLF